MSSQALSWNELSKSRKIIFLYIPKLYLMSISKIHKHFFLSYSSPRWIVCSGFASHFLDAVDSLQSIFGVQMSNSTWITKCQLLHMFEYLFISYSFSKNRYWRSSFSRISFCPLRDQRDARVLIPGLNLDVLTCLSHPTRWQVPWDTSTRWAKLTWELGPPRMYTVFISYSFSKNRYWRSSVSTISFADPEVIDSSVSWLLGLSRNRLDSSLAPALGFPFLWVSGWFGLESRCVGSSQRVISALAWRFFFFLNEE